MIRKWLPVLAAMAVAACSSSPRTQPPAPIYERGQRVESGGAVASSVETAAISGPEVSLGTTPPPALEIPQPEPATSGVPAASTVAVAAAQQPVLVSSAAQTPQAPQAAAPVRVSSTPPAAAKPMGSAGRALVAQAEGKYAAGDLTGAASALERAVRVEPQHPLPWNRLARVRLAQGSHGLAAQLAQKSNALAGDDRALKRDNWTIVSAARRGEGDLAGADEALRKADALR